MLQIDGALEKDSRIFLRSLRQGNQNSKPHACPPKPIAVLVVKCLRMAVGQGDGAVHETDAVDAGVLVGEHLLPAAVAIDPAGDAGVGAANKRDAVFD